MSQGSEARRVLADKVADTLAASREADRAGDGGRVMLGLTTPEWVTVLAALRDPAPERGDGKPSRSPWHPMSEHPAVGCNVIALYDDGSGAAMLFLHDDGMLDSDGDECGPWPMECCDRWAYLPADLEFYCEIAGEDPATIKAVPPPEWGVPEPADAGAEAFGIPDEAPDAAMDIVDAIEAALDEGALSFAPNGKPYLTWTGRQALGHIIDVALATPERVQGALGDGT